jgi:hypothetical protein
MKQLIQIYIDICLLRKGPQDLPASQILSSLCLLAYFLSGLLYWRMVETDASTALGLAVIYTGLLSISVAGLLALRRQLMRFRQTLSAFAGTSSLLTLIMIPIGHAIIQAEDGSVAAPVVLAALVLFIWSFILDAHIYRHSLSVSFTEGMLVTCLLFAVSQMIHASYVGGPA